MKKVKTGTIGVVVGAFIMALASTGQLMTTYAQSQQSQKADSTRVVTLNVPDMDCAGCEVGIKIAAGKVNGVKDVKTNSDTRTAAVTYDASKTNPEAIARAITKSTGFKVEVPKTTEKGSV